MGRCLLCVTCVGRRYCGTVSTITPSGTIPLDGSARVEGDAGGMNISWASYGSFTDCWIAGTDAPHHVVVADEGQVRTMAWTLSQVAAGLSSQGQQFRFYSDERPEHPDPLALALAEPAGLVAGERFIQLRAKLDAATAASSSEDTDVVSIDVISDNGPWLDLYRETLADQPQRGVTTEDGVRRRVEDATLGRPLFLGIEDPDQAGRLIGAVTATATASGPDAPVVGEISTLTVRDGHRRSGVGARLLNEAHRLLAAAGARTVLAFVDEGNQDALDFFRAAGYKPRAVRVHFIPAAG